jgi:RNA polymerase sigma-70 factor (ECF subfamily)
MIENRVGISMYSNISDLYEKLKDELVGWCGYMTNDRYEAEELVQEGFVRAMKNEELLRTMDAARQRAWIYQTIKHLFIDSTRKKKRESLTDEVPDTGEARQEYTEIEWIELINRLPKEEGKVFVLRYVEGLTSGQISEILKMPPGTVRSKLYDARKHLRKLLE